jgi:hypothetical protein
MWASGGHRGYIDDEMHDPRKADPAARAAAFRRAHGYNSAGIMPSAAKLILIASSSPETEEVLARMRCMGTVYDYDTHDAQSLVELIEAAVQHNEGPLGSVAILMPGCGADSDLLIKLSSAVVLSGKENEPAFLSQSARLYTGGGDVLKVLSALGHAVRENGRVDLIGCRLYSAADGKALLHKVGAQTKTHFAATENRDGAWMTVSDGFDKKGASCTTTFDAKRHYLGELEANLPPSATPQQQPAPMREPPRTTGMSASTFTFVG